MYERISWSMEDSFWVLSIMGQFTDAELTKFGMSPEVITKYRKFVKRDEEDLAKQNLGEND